MTDDELIALYGSVKLKQLPGALGKQTSQYIAMGVRASIQDDFSRPIAEAVKGPIAELGRETHHARIVMERVGKEVRYQSWTWVAVLLLLGFALGGAAGYRFFVRDLNQIGDRLDAIQQQLTPAAPAPAKPADGKAAKERRRR